MSNSPQSQVYDSGLAYDGLDYDKTEKQPIAEPWRQGGWLKPAYKTLGDMKLVAYPLHKSCRIAVTTGPLVLAYPGAKQMMTAARLAVAGRAQKQVVLATAAVGVPTVNTVTARHFGLLIRFSDSPVNADFRPFGLTIVAAAVNVNMAMTIFPNKHRLEFLLMAVVDNAGLGNLIGSDSTVVTALADTLRAGSVLASESLNERDM